MSDCLEQIKHLYPFRSHYLTIGGQRMHYVDQGQGPPIVMLHGNPTWSFFYRGLISGLSDEHRAIAPDHIGCGLSEKPQNYPYTLAQHVDNFEQLVDHLRLDAFTLVVHDWGGAIGFGYALRHPERLKRIVVLNTTAFLGPIPLRIRACRIPVFGALAVRVLNVFAGGAVRMACRNRDGMSPDVKKGYLLPYGDYRSRVAIHRFVQDIPTKPPHPSYELVQEIDASLARLKDRPMVLLWGMKDFCFNEAFLQGWIDRFPDAEVHRLDAGHYVLEDAPEDVLQLVRKFLKRTAS